MQGSTRSTSPSSTSVSPNLSTTSSSMKPQPPLQSISRMQPSTQRLSSTSKDNITLSTKSGFRRFSKESACWLVPIWVYLMLGFYASAVLLRFEYPMMIVTKTKDVFLKRLKRNKKMLTEEGSSDESKSNTMSRSIELHTNTFLDSVRSS